MISFRPERADELIGLETPPDEQTRWLERLGFEQPRRRGRRAHVPRARRDARGRRRRGGRALPARGSPVHAARAAGDVRRADAGAAACGRRVEDVLAGLGLAETYTPSLRADDPDPQALTPPGARLRRARRPAHRACCRASSRPRGATASWAPRTSRCSRSPASTCPAPACRTSTRTWPGSSRAAGRGRRGSSRRSTRRSRPSPSSSGRPTSCSIPARRPRSGPASSASSTRACSRAPGASSSSTSRALLEETTELRYTDVITYPAVRQDLAFAVADDVAAGDLVAAAHEAAGPELRTMRAFDVYHGDQVGEGRKSIAFAVSFQSSERTLSDEDAAALREKIVKALDEALRRRASRLERRRLEPLRERARAPCAGSPAARRAAA